MSTLTTKEPFITRLLDSLFCRTEADPALQIKAKPAISWTARVSPFSYDSEKKRFKWTYSLGGHGNERRKAIMAFFEYQYQTRQIHPELYRFGFLVKLDSMNDLELSVSCGEMDEEGYISQSDPMDLNGLAKLQSLSFNWLNTAQEEINFMFKINELKKTA